MYLTRYLSAYRELDFVRSLHLFLPLRRTPPLFSDTTTVMPSSISRRMSKAFSISVRPVSLVERLRLFRVTTEHACRNKITTKPLNSQVPFAQEWRSWWKLRTLYLSLKTKHGVHLRPSNGRGLDFYGIKLPDAKIRLHRNSLVATCNRSFTSIVLGQTDFHASNASLFLLGFD